MNRWGTVFCMTPSTSVHNSGTPSDAAFDRALLGAGVLVVALVVLALVLMPMMPLQWLWVMPALVLVVPALVALRAEQRHRIVLCD